jgi:hypothetical protein
VAFAGGARAECLTKPVTKQDGTVVGRNLLLAPKSEIAKYEGRGYRVETCPTGVEQLRRSTEQLCAAAAAWPVEVRQAADARRGFTFSEICASARAAVAEMELAELGGR